MTPGQILLWLALAAGVASLGAGLLRRARDASWLLRAHAATLLVALALLVVAFLASDLSYEYAWAHTRPDYPIHYKLAGVWGGEEGTILLWAAGTAAALLVVERKGGLPHRRATWALLSLSTALALILVVVDALAPTRGDQLALAPVGRGLADVLLTPYMVIHPPVQFVGYALMGVPAAYAVAHWAAGARGDRSWAGPAMKWARVAWLFATVGLGLGALWAYDVLSFGGYWAWDPVETANLLPWLALTAFLHAGKQHDKHGDHPIAAPALAVGAALLAVFATFATRSGLWVSVHAFTDPTGSFEPDPAARLLAILAAHRPTLAFLALLMAALFASVALFLLHHADALRGWARPYARGHAVALLALAGAAALDARATMGALLEASRHLVSVPVGLGLVVGALVGLPLVLVYVEDERGRKLGVDGRTMMSVAVGLFALALAATFLLNLQVVNGPDRSVFDVRAPYVVLPMASALTVTMALPPLGKRGALLLAGAGAALGLAAWALVPAHRVVALAAPFLVACAIAIVLRLARSQGTGAPPRLRVGGALLLGAAFLGFALGSNPPTDAFGLRMPDGWGPFLWAAGIALSTLALVGGVAMMRGKPIRRVEGARWREAGICVIHLAVVLGLLGYAASTYSQSREVFTAQPVGSSVFVGEHRVQIGDATTRTSDGRIDAATVPIMMDGRTRADLAFEWKGGASPQYAPAIDVRRTLAADVYVSPLAFHTPSGWVGAASVTPQRVPAGEVDMVTFSVAVLPLVGLVWTGLWLGAVGMGLVLVGARRRGVEA